MLKQAYHLAATGSKTTVVIADNDDNDITIVITFDQLLYKL